jgi:Protein of unknown function (DUF2950)
MPGSPNRISKVKFWAVTAVFSASSMAFTSQMTLAQQNPPSKNPSPVTEQPEGKAFRTPAAAAAALYAAARRDDENELLVIFGPQAKDLVIWTADPNERAEQRKMFADKYDQMHRLVKEPDNTVALYVGAENWPTPIPIVEYKGKWYFDADLGQQEVLYRRIGRNEMEALQVCNALIDAEKDYYAATEKYTSKFVSDDDSHDGLYWKASADGEKSPIGSYLAHAGVQENTARSEPYHGYYYRIVLTPNSSESAKSSFAVLAFPAEYRSSGVKTFFVEQDGTEYEKDLGPKTDEVAKQLSASDSTWSKVE